MDYRAKLEEIYFKIDKANEDKREIKLIAVSKSVDFCEVAKMSECGQVDYGENKVQILKEKITKLQNDKLNWHFIGRLQTNKINQLIDLNPILWHSCDSLQKAQEYDKRLQIKGKKQDVLLQINSANEEQKQGVSLQMASDIYMQISQTCPNLNLKGVMSIGALSQNRQEIIKSFENTYKIFESLPNASICSMGMSGDFELAIKCGANMLRIGSILFH